jgi:hypothetical protein
MAETTVPPIVSGRPLARQARYAVGVAVAAAALVLKTSLSA